MSKLWRWAKHLPAEVRKNPEGNSRKDAKHDGCHSERSEESSFFVMYFCLDVFVLVYFKTFFCLPKRKLQTCQKKWQAGKRAPAEKMLTPHLLKLKNLKLIPINRDSNRQIFLNACSDVLFNSIFSKGIL